MKTIEAIEKVREKINQNSTNDNIAFDDARIITALNEAQNKFLEWITKNHKNNDDIRLVQKFLVSDSSLTKIPSLSINSEYFSLPKNYFEFANLHAEASRKSCVTNLLLWEVKSQNYNFLLEDDNTKPSFEYSESFYYISNNNIRVFVDDFKINKLFLTYYRYPNKINVEGIVELDGSISSNQDPEWDDRTMDRIISVAVKELNINNDNLQKAQIDMQRIISEI